MVGAQWSAFYAEWSGDKCVAKQETALVDQGQDANDRRIAFRNKIVRLQFENVFEDSLPADQVKKSSQLTGTHEPIPCFGIGVDKWTNCQQGINRDVQSSCILLDSI